VLYHGSNVLFALGALSQRRWLSETAVRKMPRRTEALLVALAIGMTVLAFFVVATSRQPRWTTTNYAMFAALGSSLLLIWKLCRNVR
jgi:hypothetical protein